MTTLLYSVQFTSEELDLLYQLTRQESRRLSSKLDGVEPTEGSQMDITFKLDQKLTDHLCKRRNGVA